MLPGHVVSDDVHVAQYAGCKIIFFDTGTYIVSSTITIPAGTRVVGEAWSVIAGKGQAFQDQQHPQVVVRVGETGSEGVTEITDIIFTTVGPGMWLFHKTRALMCWFALEAAGAIVVEWNVREPYDQQGGAGMWDSHIRFDLLDLLQKQFWCDCIVH
jgi:glucan 1,3-beta-glucosidase